METNGMFLLLDYLMLAYGVYALYGVYKLRSAGEIPQALWNKDLPLRKSKDKEGFIRFMTPRLAICGALIVVNGILGILADKNPDAPLIFTIIPIAIILVVMVWYILFTRKAQKRFF